MTNKLVHGYIHRYQNLFFEDIPLDLIHICLLFYGFGSDEWDLEYICGMTLEGTTITKDFGKRSCSYLKRIAEYGQHQWRFKLENITGQIWIGILRVEHYKSDDYTSMNDCFHTKGRGYAFTPLDGNISDPETGNYSDKYGKKCNDNDIVEMHLDLEELTLGYKIDGIDYGKSHDIQKGNYRAAIYMSRANCSITLID